MPLTLAEAAFRLACGRSAGVAHAARAAPATAWPLPDFAPGADVDLSPADRCARRRRLAIAPGARRAGGARRARRLRRGAPVRDARALERRAGHDPPRPRPLRASAAATCARRSRAASSASASGSSCSRPTGSRCASPGSRRRWRAGDERRGGRRCSGTSARAASCRRTCTSRSPTPALRELPGLVTPRPARTPGASLCPDPVAAARPACAEDAGRGRAARAPARRDPARAAALLRRSARDRARPAPAPLRRARARLPRLRQQRRLRRPQPSARDGRRRPPAAPAQHELALPLREHDALRRAARRAAARSARPRLPRLHGLRGQRSRAAPGARGDGPGRPALHPRRLPRLDDRHLRGLDELGRQPAGRAGAARARASGDLARHLPRPDRRREADAGARYAEAVREAIDGLAARGRAPAAFICEALYGNAGGIVLPDGYLQAAYAHVRAAGGLCIADEVQVGYGRLGAHFWGFEQQGVVPDIVTIAKATGNGHPVAAVITTSAIADALEGHGGFFASVGGGAGLVRDRPGGARRDRGGGPAGERPARRRRIPRRPGRARRAPRARRRRARHGALPRPRPRARSRDEGAGPRGGLRDLRAAARARRDRAADGRRR